MVVIPEPWLRGHRAALANLYERAVPDLPHRLHAAHLHKWIYPAVLGFGPFASEVRQALAPEELDAFPANYRPDISALARCQRALRGHRVVPLLVARREAEKAKVRAIHQKLAEELGAFVVAAVVPRCGELAAYLDVFGSGTRRYGALMADGAVRISVAGRWVSRGGRRRKLRPKDIRKSWTETLGWPTTSSVLVSPYDECPDPGIVTADAASNTLYRVLERWPKASWDQVCSAVEAQLGLPVLRVPARASNNNAPLPTVTGHGRAEDLVQKCLSGALMEEEALAQLEPRWAREQAELWCGAIK